MIKFILCTMYVCTLQKLDIIKIKTNMYVNYKAIKYNLSKTLLFFLL